MSSGVAGLYDKTVEKVWQGLLDVLSADIRAAIIDENDYAVNLATDDFLADIPGAAIIARSGAFTGKSISGRAFSATIPPIAGVTGDPAEAIVFFHHTGSDATAELIGYQSNWQSTNPLTPNGGSVAITQDSGAFKLWRL